jgi:TRAP-type C4-dicarboxylate transport system permease small subunit
MVPEAERRGLAGRIERLAEAFALAGGLLLVGVVCVNAWSILARALAGRPFPGTFELTEMGVAVAVFLFLPWCQITGATVTADIFTSRASPRWIARLGIVAAVVAFGVSLLLAERMWLGLIDQRGDNLTTAILQLPVWWAFVPILAALLLLAACALVSLHDARRAAKAS